MCTCVYINYAVYIFYICGVIYAEATVNASRILRQSNYFKMVGFIGLNITQIQENQPRMVTFLGIVVQESRNSP
jgi:hypothetical protein